MDYKFETFEKPKGGRPGRGLRLSISKKGVMFFYKNLTHYFSEKGKFINFHYDPKARVIGLGVTNEERPSSYRIGFQKKKSVSVASAQAFLRHYSIPYEKPRTYEAEIDKETGYILIDLKKKE